MYSIYVVYSRGNNNNKTINLKESFRRNHMKKNINPKLQALLDMNAELNSESKSIKSNESFAKQMKNDESIDDYTGYLLQDSTVLDNSQDDINYDDMELNDYYLD